MLLAFTLAIEEFGVPAALGSRAGVVMLTVGIEKKLADWPVDLPGAALLSLLLMAVALFARWLQRRLVGEKEVTSVTGKPGRTTGIAGLDDAARRAGDGGRRRPGGRRPRRLDDAHQRDGHALRWREC